ncbi:hypothetical protein CTM97_11750 [Photobacterium phosphoreum]|uniref:Uncharacterized protein n=2 Tax=Photobacterium phosphoreum TaxID=659 RepID=A0A2T3JK18_PHOPO|nr:hypothetical protein CTM96_14170 [Photobacterium phosphoreum]PSU41690.1 hypothetical protein CTM97_11750 [Photobacterium phosphoreum]PSU49287.1 hypothetical protein C9J18_15855 [Photobacterium phosphoreum]
MVLLLTIIPFRAAATVYLNVNPNQVNGIANTIGLSFANGYVVNLGNPDYRIQLFMDNQWKQHCNTGSTAPNFYGSYYDSNQSKNSAFIGNISCDNNVSDTALGAIVPGYIDYQVRIE